MRESFDFKISLLLYLIDNLDTLPGISVLRTFLFCSSLTRYSLSISFETQLPTQLKHIHLFSFLSSVLYFLFMSSSLFTTKQELPLFLRLEEPRNQVRFLPILDNMCPFHLYVIPFCVLPQVLTVIEFYYFLPTPEIFLYKEKTELMKCKKLID